MGPRVVTRNSWTFRGLTFELRRDRQQNARPARWTMRQPTARAWRFDVGPRLERGVRQHGGSNGKTWSVPLRPLTLVN